MRVTRRKMVLIAAAVVALTVFFSETWIPQRYRDPTFCDEGMGCGNFGGCVNDYHVFGLSASGVQDCTCNLTEKKCTPVSNQSNELGGKLGTPNVPSSTSPSSTSSESNESIVNCQNHMHCFEESFLQCNPSTFSNDSYAPYNFSYEIMGWEGSDCVLHDTATDGSVHNETCRIPSANLTIQTVIDLVIWCEGNADQRIILCPGEMTDWLMTLCNP